MDIEKNNIRRREEVAQFCNVTAGGGRVLCYRALQKRVDGLKHGTTGITQRENDPMYSFLWVYG